MMNIKTSPLKSQENNQNIRQCTFLIVGGGISGVSCAETINFLAPNESIFILAESSLIKSVTNLVQLGKYAQRFDVEEITAKDFEKHNVEIITDQLKAIESKSKIAITENGVRIAYKSLCICTGARPKLIHHPEVEEFIIGIRDTDTVKEFQRRIKNSKRFALIGNGGIASEIIYEINNIEIEWIIKDQHMSSTFIDPGASKFFEDRLKNKEKSTSIIKRMRYMEESGEPSKKKKGAALGPDWHRLIDMSGNSETNPDNIRTHFGVEVKSITRSTSDFPVYVELSNGEKILVDFVVSATGVDPNKSFECLDNEFKLGPDGGIWINELMKTSIDSIFAAGDVCYAGWEHSKFWHQMRLWTQARQMGMMAGKSMVAELNKEEIYQDFCFELFSHVTKLYGFQVVLLGRYNGQELDNNYELLFRITPNQEYIKFVLKDGKLVGALLIGETSLEETCENLILNQIDLTPFGDDILNPNIDIEDYFD
jgi:pyridine nucleotide-disulfide oxidoreductase domain-containing protein 1